MAGLTAIADPKLATEGAVRSAPAAVLRQAERLGGREYVRYFRDGEWRSLSWTEFAEKALRVAEGLVAAGIGPGERVALLSPNRVEWLLCDLGIQAAGCVTVPIYPSSRPRTVKHIVSDCDARLLVASGPEL